MQRKTRLAMLTRRLEKLVNDLEVSLLDAEQDDRWIHLAAIEFDGYILSHDQFRDEIEQWEEEGRHDIVEEIKKRRVELQFFEEHTYLRFATCRR